MPYFIKNLLLKARAEPGENMESLGGVFDAIKSKGLAFVGGGAVSAAIALTTLDLRISHEEKTRVAMQRAAREYTDLKHNEALIMIGGLKEAQNDIRTTLRDMNNNIREIEKNTRK